MNEWIICLFFNVPSQTFYEQRWGNNYNQIPLKHENGLSSIKDLEHPPAPKGKFSEIQGFGLPLLYHFTTSSVSWNSAFVLSRPLEDKPNASHRDGQGCIFQSRGRFFLPAFRDVCVLEFVSPNHTGLCFHLYNPISCSLLLSSNEDLSGCIGIIPVIQAHPSVPGSTKFLLSRKIARTREWTSLISLP